MPSLKSGHTTFGKLALRSHSFKIAIPATISAMPPSMPEEYHQNYYAKNPTAGYCVAVVAPKVAKFRSKFSEMMKARTRYE